MRVLVLVLLTLAAVPVHADPFPKRPHVYVEGSAEIRVEPDMLELDVWIDAVDRDLEVAKTRADTQANQLITSCKDLGIAPEDIASSNLEIGPAYEYRNDQRQLVGTRVSHSIEITLRDLQKYPALIAALTSSRIGGISSATLKSSKATELLAQAQQAALSDARQRAERLAVGSGRKLGEAYSISEFDQRQGERYLLRPSRELRKSTEGAKNLRALADDGGSSEPFEPGQIVAAATVYVIYLTEPK